MEEDKKLLERGINNWSEDSIRMILTPSSTAKKLFFYIQEVGYFKTSYPYFSERKNLDSFLIIFTISGKGYLKYNGQEYTLTKGQCFFIHCEKHHVYYAGKKEDWEFLWVHFNGSNSLGYYKEFTRNGFRVIQCQDSFLWERTIWRMIALYRLKNLTTETITSNLINVLLTELLVETATNSADTFLIPDYVRTIVKDIDKNYKQNLPLSHFEKLCHRSRYHISREFKKYIGITINEYIITTRISHAKDLLKYSDLSVSEIAFEIGTNNITHFINLFKARENITPLTYRKKWKNLDTAILK